MTYTNKFHVTLPALRRAGACYCGYNRLVRYLQGKEFTESDAIRETYLRFANKGPVSIRTILDSNGLDDALWTLRCIDNADSDKDLRMYAVWCASQVKRVMTDARSTEALNVAWRHAQGQATDGELMEAGEAAWAAAREAAWEAAWEASREAAVEAAREAALAALGAWAAAWAAWAAAGEAAGAAAREVTWAAWAAAGEASEEASEEAAREASVEAAREAAREASEEAQKNRLIQMLTAGRF